MRQGVGWHFKNQMIKIRCATDSDRAEILGVHGDAFGKEQGPEIVDLVTGLLSDKTAEPRFSFVAENGGRIVGHILFTAIRLQSNGPGISAQILAPLAVSKEHQGKGVGGLLINEGLKQLTASGFELVFVLGHPDYYPKFGFKPAGILGYEAPYAIPIENANAWMVIELKAGIIGSVSGRVQCAATLDQPEHWRE